MELDINTKFISDEVQIWAFHAGHNKKYFNEFAELEANFLDLPGFPFAPAVIENDELVKKALVMSEAFRQFGRGVLADPPSRNINDYNVNPDDERSLRTGVTNVRRFAQEIQPGDIIICPPRRQYDHLLIGISQEVLNPEATVQIHPFEGYPFTYRRVEWLPTRHTKRSLSDTLAVRMENPHAIIKIDRREFGDEVFSLAFKNYLTSQNSKLDIDCPHYRGKNPLETLAAQELIAFFAALYFLYEENRLNEIAGKTFDEIITDYYDEEVISGLVPKLNSPLLYRLISRRRLLASFIAGGIALSAAGALNADVLNDLRLSNSAEAEMGYAEDELRDILQSTVRATSPQALAKANQKGRKGQEEVGLKTAARIRPQP